jgi:hypothetical protein
MPRRSIATLGIQALHHKVESALAASVAPVGVVRAVHAQSDKEVMLLEESAPCVAHWVWNVVLDRST